MTNSKPQVVDWLENIALGVDEFHSDWYSDEELKSLASDTISLLKKQEEVIDGLRKVGYPHGYEQEEPWIVDYMNLITEVIKKAVKCG